MTQALNLALLANNVNSSGQLNGATGLYGTIPLTNFPTVTPAYGGLGTTGTPTNGQVPIGNGTNFTLSTLTAGTGINITNSSGGISIAATGTSGFPGVLGQAFTSNGTFTIPTGVTALKVTVTGGGGNGYVAGGLGYGGGAGGTAIAYLTGLTSGNTLSVTVGGAAGNSTVSSGTQSISTITGGGGANSSSSGAGGGGSASGGTINIGGGGGQVGGGTDTFGGVGGNSFFGGGGAGQYVNRTPVNASGYGGGGGSNGSGSAGSGYQGVVIFEW